MLNMDGVRFLFASLVTKRLPCRLPGVVLLVLLAAGIAASGAHAEPGEKKEPAVVVVDSPEITDLLETLGKPLVRAAGLQEDLVHFHVILNNQLNAMALPNGHLVFNSGLVLECASPEELASVMAHETAHLAAGHHLRMQSEMRSASIQAMLAAIVGITAGAVAKNSSLAEAGVIGGSAAAQSVMLDSMREKESQADRLGIRYLAASGYDPGGMGSFMRHLLEEQRKASLPAPYLLTHPLSVERVLDAERTVATVTVAKVNRPKVDVSALKRVQAVLLASTETDPKEAEAIFNARLKKDPKDWPSQYGLAIVYRYAGETQKASGLLDGLLALHPNDPYILREKGLLLLEKGQSGAAEKLFTLALARKPDDPDIRYRLSLSLSDGGKLEEAAKILRRLTVERPTVPVYQYQLGVVEGQRDRLGHAHLAMARYFALLMDDKMALFHYNESINRFLKSDREHDIAQAELKRFKEEFRKFRQQ
ncbi:MAG: M48 family metalloprotease [Magnetococcales bacterium]|nr:M48 family metalloprotease [Magnetococcales bacterium]